MNYFLIKLLEDSKLDLTPGTCHLFTSVNSYQKKLIQCLPHGVVVIMIKLYNPGEKPQI